MKFYEYDRGKVNPLPYPATTDLADGRSVFLIMAENQEEAELAAKLHLEGKELICLKDVQLNHQVSYAYIDKVACV